MNNYQDCGKFEPFKTKVWLSSPTMHGPELELVSSCSFKFMEH